MSKNSSSWGIYGNRVLTLSLSLVLVESVITPGLTKPPSYPEKTVNCDILVIGGGLSGVATAYEGLLAGKAVCLTEITDWVGGQISAQGNSALDEGDQQRSLGHFPRGYQELRERIKRYYRTINPGKCWVSYSCFIPRDAHQLLFQQLQDAAVRGNGKLNWFPNTIVKELELNQKGNIIEGVIAIQSTPTSQQFSLNNISLSHTIRDMYSYKDSSGLKKQIIHFIPSKQTSKAAKWYVVEATETGEIIALADLPYRLGLDPRSGVNPSSPTEKGDPYCTQGFTYPFAMEQTKTPQLQEQPSFYQQYQPYYSYDTDQRKANFDYLFTYRRIWSPNIGKVKQVAGVKFTEPMPGDISMQNWVWGNDYRPGTQKDNLIYTRQQLQEKGQLKPGEWMGGLRQETLRKGEEQALGFYYWLVAGTTDSQLGERVKQPYPNHRLLTGLNSPMGTGYGLSKYPYIRESRRIIGRTYTDYSHGFSINEIDISNQDYFAVLTKTQLPGRIYLDVLREITRLEAITRGTQPISKIQYSRRTASTSYPDAVGVSQYTIDFHPCMQFSPPESPNNKEREGIRLYYPASHPSQIPLRAMIPQKVDNLLVTGKSIATSNIAAAAYRVQSFEWSVGAATGTTAVFALEKDIFPYKLVDNLPGIEPELFQLRQRLDENGNPTKFPD